MIGEFQFNKLLFMDLYVKSLQTEVYVKLSKINGEEKDVLTSTRECILLLEGALEKLKAFIKSYDFKDEAEEIRFFKELKPELLSNLIFYYEVYNMEITRPKGEEKVRHEFLRKELQKINEFFRCNTDIYFYYRLGNTLLDREYFLRGKQSVQIIQEVFYFERDPEFSTLCDFKLAKILANEMLETYLLEQLANSGNRYIKHQSDLYSGSKLKWEGSKIDLIELIYAIYETGYITYDEKSLKLLKNTFEKLFNINLGNISRAMYDLRIRENPTKFLDKLKKLLINRMKKYEC